MIDYTRPLLSPLDMATLIHGDCRLALPLLPSVDVVLTDPPYMWFTSLVTTDAETPLEAKPPSTYWPPYAWAQQWFPLLLQRVRVGLWLVTDRRFVAFYDEPTVPRRAWALRPEDEREPWLLYYGRPLRDDPSPETLAAYRYGTNSPVAFWAGLLAVTPTEGGLLCDPFCGTGSGLVAGLDAGYRVVGIEDCEDVYDRCVARVRPWLDD